MVRHKSLIRIAAVLPTLILMSALPLSARTYEQIVCFDTTLAGSASQLNIVGTLNTLAKGHQLVSLGNATANVNGKLKAKLIFDVQGNSVELVGVDFLENSITQDPVSLFYDVPATTRRVLFDANDVSFSITLTDILDSPQQNLLAQASLDVPHQLVQHTGKAKVTITDRPAQEQDLIKNNALSTYMGTGPQPQSRLNDFSLTPMSSGGSDYLVNFTLPIQSQRVHYSGVGLPVFLDYTGTLRFAGQVAISAVPEPSTTALAAAALLAWWGSRRSPKPVKCRVG